MKPWEHPDAADQIPDPDGHDDGAAPARSAYDKGVVKSMEAVIIAIDSGSTTAQVRDAAVAMIEHIQRKETE